MSETSIQAASLPERSMQRGSAPNRRSAEWVSDVALASAVARAVRTVPGVVDLSPGLVIQRATYGAGERVTGIVVHHPAPDAVVLEIHVFLSEADCGVAGPGIAHSGAARHSEALDALRRIATNIRETVHAAVRDMLPPAVVRADVLIDDLL